MLEVDAISTDIEELCKQLGITRHDVFGSATTDRFGPDSDVDILVRFDDPATGLFSRYFDLKETLERLLGRQVDVVIEDAIKNPYFKESVEQSRRNVYAA